MCVSKRQTKGGPEQDKAAQDPGTPQLAALGELLTACVPADSITPIVVGSIGFLGALLFKSSSFSHWQSSKEARNM